MTEQSATRRWYLWALLALICVYGLYLRTGKLTTTWMNPDEGIYLHASSLPNYGRMLQATTPHHHPPLYFSLLWLIRKVTDDYLLFRSISLVSGVASIWLFFLIGAEVGGAAGGIAIALLAALSPASINLSQLVRPYMLSLVFLQIGVLGALRFARGQGNGALRLFAWGFGVAVLLHYNAVAVIAGIDIALLAWFLMRKIGRPDLIRLIKAHQPLFWCAMVGAMVNLQFSFANPQAQGLRETIYRALFIHEPSQLLTNTVGMIGYLADPERALLGALFLLLSVMICLAARRDLPVLACLAGLGFSLALAAFQIYPYGGSRHSFHLIVFALLPIAGAVGLCAARGALGWSLIALATIKLATLPPGSGLASYAAQNQLVPFPSRIEFPVDKTALISLYEELERTKDQGGTVVVDQQSFYVIAILLRRSGIEAVEELRYRWGKRILLISRYWHLNTESDLAGIRKVAIQERKKRDPETPEGDPDVSFLLAGGWGYADIAPRIRELAQSGSARILADGEGAFMFELDGPAAPDNAPRMNE